MSDIREDEVMKSILRIDNIFKDAGQGRLLIYALIGLLVSLTFGYVVYNKASSVMYAQSLAELKRSADASQAEFKVRAEQMMFGMTQAAAEPHIKEALKRKDVNTLSELIRRWKRDRPYIEIWAFTDSQSRIVSMLGTGGHGKQISFNGVLTRAMQTGLPVKSVEKVPLPEINVFGSYLGDRVVESLEGVGDAGKHGMVQVVAVPVNDDGGECLGIILTGIVLNANNELVNRIYESQDVNNAVFSGEYCIAKRFEVAGLSQSIKMSDRVRDVLYNDGSSYEGKETILGNDYIAIYKPVTNADSKVIGAQLVALQEEQYRVLPGWIRNTTVVVSLFMGAVFFLIAIYFRGLKVLIDREKQHNILLNDLRNFSAKLHDCVSEEEISQLFIRHIKDRYELCRVFLVLVNHEKNSMFLYQPPGEDGGVDDGELERDFVLEKCKPFLTGRILTCNGGSRDYPCNAEHAGDVSSYICIPLIVGGKIIGVAHLGCTLGNYWDDERINHLHSYIDYLVSAISNIRLLKMFEQKAFEDQLTGVKNRRYMDEFLHQQMEIAKRQEEPLSVLMLDIDYFKRFNDRFGHDAGDTALKIFARTIKECLRDADLLARYGGEEFTVVLVNTDVEGARMVAERIRSTVEQLKLNKISLLNPPRITVSIGVATFPQHGEDPKSLLKVADQAMYVAKGAGRNRVRVPEEIPAETVNVFNTGDY